MTPEMAAKLKRSITLHESRRKYPYVDTTGHITIGLGYNLTARGISDNWIDSQYDADSSYCYQQLGNSFPWFPELNEDRQIALTDMCFNLGFKNFCDFHEMIDSFIKHDYVTAAHAMLSSQWAKQVTSRATTLAHVILSGVYQI